MAGFFISYHNLDLGHNALIWENENNTSLADYNGVIVQSPQHLYTRGLDVMTIQFLCSTFLLAGAVFGGLPGHSVLKKPEKPKDTRSEKKPMPKKEKPPKNEENYKVVAH